MARSFSQNVATFYTLCTSGFVDDVIFSHDGPMARHVYTQAATQQLLIVSWASGGTKSALYECVVLLSTKLFGETKKKNAICAGASDSV